jgi:hypothetical protein
MRKFSQVLNLRRKQKYLKEKQQQKLLQHSMSVTKQLNRNCLLFFFLFLFVFRHYIFANTSKQNHYIELFYFLNFFFLFSLVEKLAAQSNHIKKMACWFDLIKMRSHKHSHTHTHKHNAHNKSSNNTKMFALKTRIAN